jgi:Ca2+-binding RTX toxin-like protein
MRGLGGADTLRGRGANDKLTGGPGIDNLSGALGSDTYLFDDGWGEDHIVTEGGGVDTLDFSALSARVRVDLVPTAGQPEASSGTNTVFISNTDTVIEKVRGGANGDDIKGNSANNTFFGNGDLDFLRGGSGNDALFGGAAGDAIQGQEGADSLAGGGGSDDYRNFAFEGAIGQDTITDSPISDPARFTGNEVGLNNFTDDMIINLVSDPSQPEVKFTSATTLGSINWSANGIDNVRNLSSNELLGDDTIFGNSGPNEIYSLGGQDTIDAGGGDDFIHVQDQSGGDEVDCGDGTDTVAFDNSDLINFVDCEASP